MPVYSSSHFQPLGISVFAPLKKAYRSLVEEKTRRGHQYINKINFMGIYQTTREKAFTLNNIASAFRVTGLILFNPEEIFGGFTMQLNTPSPLHYQAVDLLNRL